MENAYNFLVVWSNIRIWGNNEISGQNPTTVIHKKITEIATQLPVD